MTDHSLATNPLPAHIRVSDARLPATYEQAKTALAQCSRIDECQEWADKAEALASYARQADDDGLRKLADRIQARAVRRCGELLKQLDGRQGQNLPAAKSGGAPTFSLSRRDAAKQAGLSKDQQVTAVRVANVPAEQFEQAIDSDKPPTVTALAEIGKQSRPAPAAAPSPFSEHAPPPAAALSAVATAPAVTAPAGFKQATHLIGVVGDFAAFCQQSDPAVVASGLMKSEIQKVRDFVSVIDSWLDRFVVSLAPDKQA
jgi:predicted transcriptional regulator